MTDEFIQGDTVLCISKISPEGFLTRQYRTVTYLLVEIHVHYPSPFPVRVHQQKHILARPACGRRGGRGEDYELCTPVAKLSSDFAPWRKLNPFCIVLVPALLRYFLIF